MEGDNSTVRFNNPVSEYMYNTYNGKGAHPDVYIPALILFSSMLIGYVGNTLVILATWKNKTLHGSCNFFLSLCCLGDILHQSAHWPYAYLTLSGQNFMSYKHCLWFQTIPMIGLNLSICMTLFVGFDRLISVLFPTSYRRINVKAYIAICLLVVFGINCYFIYLPYAAKDMENAQVMCIILDGMGGGAAEQWFLVCVLVNIADLIIYTAVWILIRFRAGTSESTKRIFRSLQVIMFSVVGGWLVNAFVMGVIVPAIKVPVNNIYYFQAYFGFLPNFASAANFIPLYIFSYEYRITFQQILAPIFPCIKVQKLQQVTTVEQSKSAISMHG
ncbi:G-PROTEIN-RECEP-F1-2 domain-containing protein [Aphelenchoides bicaudatus]|nr:G-PROTEIN-RECEP-F1-2 domain-containing protein [Aphelenchoides bicaudatus]